MGAAMNDGRPEVSVVIPVYNEALILEESVTALCAALRERGWAFEIILAENGSRDETPRIGEDLGRRYPEVSIFRHPEPNYGGALRQGILRASGRFVICEEIDLCDAEQDGIPGELVARQPDLRRSLAEKVDTLDEILRTLVATRTPVTLGEVATEVQRTH